MSEPSDDLETVTYGYSDEIGETFPSFQQSEHFERLLHLLCCNLSSFRGWKTSRNGQYVRKQLFQSFHGALLPEQLALSLGLMLNLCPYQPPNPDIQSSSRTSLASLSDLLHGRKTIEESYTFLLHLARVFAYTATCVGDENILRLVDVLTPGARSMQQADSALHCYLLERWNSQEHTDAMAIARPYEFESFIRPNRRKSIP